MNKVTKGMAIAAANWWAEKISKNEEKSNGSDDLASVMSSLLATKMAEDHIPSIESLEKFKESLTDIILSRDLHMLDTDYVPDSYLTDVAPLTQIIAVLFLALSCYKTDKLYSKTN